jgi:hypothetical protein
LELAYKEVSKEIRESDINTNGYNSNNNYVNSFIVELVAIG